MTFDKCPSCGQMALLDQAVPRQQPGLGLNKQPGQVIYARICEHCGKLYGGDVPVAVEILSSLGTRPMFADYVQTLLLVKEGVVCMCGEYVFEMQDLHMYPHDGGLYVPYKDEKQWVYGQCQNTKCKYQMAAWKMKQYRRRKYD